MANIYGYNQNLPIRVKFELSEFVLQDMHNRFNAIELVVLIRKEELNVKEFSSYLNFIYRIDGHLSELGLLSYSHHPERQIAIREIRIGSYEVVFRWVTNFFSNYNNLILLFLALKFLPKVIQSYLNVVYRAYEIMNIREEYLEKLHRREKREEKEQRIKKEKRIYKKELRELLKEEIPHLDKKQREKVVEAITQLYLRIGSGSISAARFAQKVIQDIELRPENKE